MKLIYNNILKGYEKKHVHNSKNKLKLPCLWKNNYISELYLRMYTQFNPSLKKPTNTRQTKLYSSCHLLKGN